MTDWACVFAYLFLWNRGKGLLRVFPLTNWNGDRALEAGAHSREATLCMGKALGIPQNWEELLASWDG